MRRLLVIAVSAALVSPAVAQRALVADSPKPLHMAASDAPVTLVGADNMLVAVPDAYDAGRRYVLQLDAPITPERRAALFEIGVELGGYLPEHAYIVDLSEVDPLALAAEPGLMWVGEYRTEWKLSPVIGIRESNRPYDNPERAALAERGEVVVDVSLFTGLDHATALDEMEQLGALIHRVDTYDDGVEATLTMPLIDVPLLAEFDAVQFVEEAPDIVFRNNTVRWIAQSDTSGNFPIYDGGLHGEGQVAGVMDGRVDVGHCSFDDNNPIGPSHRKILAYNAPLGSDFHGTHVAATVCGDNGNNNDTRGLAYEAKFVFDDVPSFTNSGIFNALSLHHNQGARVHTNSWGNDGTTAYDGLCRGIDRFMFQNEESLALWAATNLSTLKNPENAKNQLAVGASQDAPSQNSWCSGGTGPTSDGRRKPEVALPGCGIQSASSGSNCSTVGLSGTSMAAPAVAGAALLVRQYYTEGYHPTGAANAPDAFTPSGALVKATLLNSTVNMTNVGGYPSNQEGWGRIKLNRAMFFTGEARTTILEDVFNGAGMSTGEMTEMPFEVLDTRQLKVTLAWTEPAATSGSSAPSINDLDLEVVDPTGAIYKGNRFVGGESATGGAKDSLNNVEQVFISSPTVGSWIARVKGTAVNQGTQGYALIATGGLSSEPPNFCPTDFNQDGATDLSDLATLLANFGLTGVGNSQGDTDGDGDVDLSDLAALLAEFGASC